MAGIPERPRTTTPHMLMKHRFCVSVMLGGRHIYTMTVAKRDLPACEVVHLARGVLAVDDDVASTTHRRTATLFVRRNEKVLGIESWTAGGT